MLNLSQIWGPPHINGDFYIRADDEGIGIPADKIDKVLMPFTQAENGLVRNHEGLGLGLSLVSGYIKMHFGRLRIQSKINQGTSVTIIMPKSCVVNR
ncbi:MAG: hypothetical protein HRU28_14305 [Rhizobiales bacterium]|nr:hypothetical protein [Hyphomicrobiales bacterium]